MDTKKLVAGIVVAGTLVFGATGIASAADGTGSGSGATATAPATKGHPVIRRHVRRAGLRDVLNLTSTSPQELKTALQGGQTIGQYAAAHGSSRDAVVNDLTQKLNAFIAKAESNGRITSARAATLEGKVSGVVTKFVDRTWGQKAVAPSQS
jgi:uncharacterized protein YidB (DUF937 family)